MNAAFSVLPHRSQVLPGGRNQPVARVSEADEEPPHDGSAEGFRSIWTVRRFLLVQIGIFLAMISIHFGLLVGGYRHQNAGTTESVIAAVLVVGLLLTWMPPPWSRRAAIAAQSFGTLGVLAGLVTSAVGIGPRTILDLALNAVSLLTLIAGLAITKRGARHVQPVHMGS
jgi:hypothetical protein